MTCFVKSSGFIDLMTVMDDPKLKGIPIYESRPSLSLDCYNKFCKLLEIGVSIHDVKPPKHYTISNTLVPNIRRLNGSPFSKNHLTPQLIAQLKCEKRLFYRTILDI
jgi:hypothetical protein